MTVVNFPTERRIMDVAIDRMTVGAEEAFARWQSSMRKQFALNPNYDFGHNIPYCSCISDEPIVPSSS